MKSSTTKSIRWLTQCAVIAALYAAMTFAAGALNLAYGPVQFRFSEALTILPSLRRLLCPACSWGA